MKNLLKFRHASVRWLNELSHKLLWVDRVGRTPILPILLVALPLLLVVLSVWEGSYTYDSHHWGLMLSNAKDLYEGKIPYQEIFIQYGILTTIIQSIAFYSLDKNLLSLIFITSAFYGIGVVGVYFLSLRVSGDKKIAVFSFVTVYLLHPVAILPWSNYIAFPFLVFGVLFLLDENNRSINAFIAGTLLSLAILSREGLMPAILAFSSVACFLKALDNRYSFTNRIEFSFIFFTGLSLPVACFFYYLVQEDLLSYWYKTSVLLPQIYKESMMPNGIIGAIGKIIQFFLKGTIVGNPRIIIYGLITSSALYYIYLFFRTRKTTPPDQKFFLIAILTILLLSASLHLQEIFRLATSVALGIVLFYIFVRRFRCENTIFFIVSIILISSFIFSSIRTYYFPGPFDLAGNGNYNAPFRSEIISAVEIHNPRIFDGQKWSPEAANFYRSLNSDMIILSKADCGIRYFQNTSQDAFIAALSPFRQFQLAPFFNLQSWEKLRPDLNTELKIAEDRDIVLFLKLPQTVANDYSPPKGYILVRNYTMPRGKFAYGDDAALLVVVPENCGTVLKN